MAPKNAAPREMPALLLLQIRAGTPAPAEEGGEAAMSEREHMSVKELSAYVGLALVFLAVAMCVSACTEQAGESGDPIVTLCCACINDSPAAPLAVADNESGNLSAYAERLDNSSVQLAAWEAMIVEDIAERKAEQDAFFGV
ncbi:MULTISPECIES: hypothetical protein [unclassified Methanoregula]|uniref:hypothetical protein n=1 Tax=unclassified Methanoregula TaxID=2649730 RepID=UPI0025D90759|nr:MULTISPECIES: hypothetical protein [unclassified Methanoregula]